MGKNYFYLFIIFLFCFSGKSYSQEKSKNFWKKTSNISTVSAKNIFNTTKPTNTTIYKLDIKGLKNTLKSVPQRNFKITKSSVILSFPNSEGKMERFSIFEASVMHPDLQKKYPNIRSYVGKGIDDVTATIRFSVTPLGLKSMVLSSGKKAMFIAPYSKDLTHYIVYAKQPKTSSFECLVEENVGEKIKSSLQERPNADDGILRTYRLAMSATAEYTQYFGGTKAAALAAIVATMTRVNGIFEIDFNVNMILIANTDDVIYTNTATDPYDGNPSYNTEVQNTITSVIGEANYDIGHLVHNGTNNGNAGCIGCVCVDNSKGSAFTSHSTPEGDNFDIDYVAHEMGHQFGGNHTWTHGGNEGTNVQMEPGSGSTIMGYAGITGATDVQAHSDAYFHAASIQQVTNYVKSTICQTNTATGNNVPTALAGLDFTIPKSTAFILTGDGIDADGANVLTFCWEQMDENNATTTYPSITATTGVAFRSFLPTISKLRYFPTLSTVLNGSTASKWEAVPDVARNLNFRLTVRDNVAGGGTNNSDDMVVTIDATKGPLQVTSQAATGITWLSGANETITWNVNSTNTLSGSANVNILLSTDGGLTYPTTLVSNTPNDGSQVITVPNTPAPFCRVMVQPTGNIFFALNTVDFAIDYTVTTTCTTYSDTPNMAITDNSATFDTTGINIPDNVTITDINVSVDITHTYLGDLLIAVLSPVGTQVDFFERSCSSNDDMTVTFDDAGATLVCASPTTGTYAPSNPLSAFNSEASLGMWTLGINDNANQDTGTLNSWSVEVCSTTQTPLAVKKFEFSEFSVYPNPSNGTVNVSLLSNSSEDSIAIKLYDLMGRLISTQTFKSFSSQFNKEISFGNLASGVYLLKVERGNQFSVKQLAIF
ncbi:zinc-dependent metalloprotease [Lutibacter sp.]